MFARIAAADENARLILIGEGEDREMLIDAGAEHGLTGRVSLTGNVTNVQEYLCAMDVFALPSQYEGLGIVAVEAQATGLPVVASKGVPQEIEIRMRVMRSCWGNCRPSRRIVTFNAFLAAVPDESLAYVVAHELTHFLHADHSAAFYAALARVMPDWKPRRAALKDYQAVPF